MYCKKGFTIIELLVTLAILGILITSVIPVLTGVEKKAKDSSILQVAASIRSGMEAYHQINSSYPLEAQVGSWIDLDMKLDVIELGQMDRYNIGVEHPNVSQAFNYESSEDDYKIEIASNFTGRIYVITKDDFFIKAGD